MWVTYHDKIQYYYTLINNKPSFIYNIIMKKIYVITGSTSGIGKALVEEFSKDNIVFAGYRNEDLKLQGHNIIPFYIDLSKPETIQPAIEYINSQHKITTLINAAGYVVAGPMELISQENLKRQFDVNVFSAIELSKGLNPSKIINISSMSSFGIYPFIAPYCASKRSLDILFNLYGIESGINVISIKLGSVATPIWNKSIKENQSALQNSKQYESETKYLIKNAQKNEIKGMPVKKVVEFIKKKDSLKNPKPSYTLGFDAKVTEIFSHLPQSFINFVIKQKLKNMKNK